MVGRLMWLLTSSGRCSRISFSVIPKRSEMYENIVQLKSDLFIISERMIKKRNRLKPWDKIWCFWEKNSYKVIWRNKRFIIIAKPFYAIKNFIYSIIDLQQGRMWPDNRLFGWYDYLKREDAERAIKDLESWDLEISERRGCRLVVPDRIQKQRR